MQDVRSILVIRLSAIGDIILTTPVVRRLRNRWPDARIDFCTRASYASLLSNNPNLSTLYDPDSLPSTPYDLVVDLQNSRRSRRIVRRTAHGQVVGYRKENWKKWLLVHTGLDLYRGVRSVVDRYMDALAAFGVSDDGRGCELFPAEEERRYADSLLGGGESVRLAVCFGAKHFTKRWPPASFAETISRILAAAPVEVFLLGGGEDAGHADAIMGRLRADEAARVRNLAGRCSLMQSAALLERMDAVLTNDTGLMHMASAFRKHLFVLFGSSSPLLGFLPYATAYDLFEVEGLACRPCSHIGRDRCPKGHFRCMEELLPSRVASVVVAWIGSLRR